MHEDGAGAGAGERHAESDLGIGQYGLNVPPVRLSAFEQKELPRCGILDESVMEEVEELTKAPPTTFPSYLNHPYVLSFRASSFAKPK